MTRRWPLLLLALPAFVATWSGWVGLGRMVGFGVVTPLPGILDDFTIDTAITLPIGVETYAAYALNAWLTAREVGAGTRSFAKWSAIGSLLLGALGQVAFHLLAVYGMTAAPWQVVTVVSCLPVLVLGMGAALGHMLARDAQAVPVIQPESADAEAVPSSALKNLTASPGIQNILAEDHEPADFPDLGNGAVPAQVHVPAGFQNEKPGAAPQTALFDWATEAADDWPAEPQATGVPELIPGDEPVYLEAASRFLGDVVSGSVPGVRRLKTELGIGQDKAQLVRAYLASLANA